MSEQEEFFNWLHDWLRDNNFTLNYQPVDEMNASWQACAERKDKIIEQQSVEIAALTQLIHEMSGAIWRLRKYHYLVEQEPPDSDDQAQMDHWLDILDYCIGQSRIIVKRANETGKPTALLKGESE